MSLDKAKSVTTFSAYMASPVVKQRVTDVIGGERGQSFITHIVSAVSANPQLAACEHGTIFSAALTGESLNLAPNPQLGYYYIVPYKEKDKKGNIIRVSATFQIGYRGLVQLALRTGQYADIDVLDVRQGEYLGRDKYTGKYLFEFIADDEEREKREVIGYMAYFELLNGFKKTLYWSKSKMEKHAAEYSASYKYDIISKRKESFWSKDFDKMAFKTMLRQLLSKWGIMSTEMQVAYEKDMTAEKDGKSYYVDNPSTDGLENLPIDYGDIGGLDDDGKGGSLDLGDPAPVQKAEGAKDE